MSEMKEFDIIVAGAGPAGLYAAYTASLNGLSVLVLEKDKEIGKPILCAEGVSNRTLELFFDTFPKEIIRNSFNKLIVKYKDTVSCTDIPDMGIILNRELFDKYIALLAINNGVTIKTDEPVINGNRENNKMIIETHTNKYIAKIFIAADGVESRCARYFGINTTTELNDIYSCCEYILIHENINENEIIFDYSPKFARYGYTWVFPRGGNEANVGLGIIPSKSKKKAKEILEEYIDLNYRNANILEKKAGAVPVNPLKKSYANNLLIIGDAGRYADPITGGGIDNALRTGRFAALTAERAIEMNDLSDKSMKYYNNLIKKDNLLSLKMQLKLKNIMENMKDRELDEMFHSILSMLNNKEILSNEFYESVNGLQGILERIKQFGLLIKGIASKRTMIRILLKLLWV